MASINYTNYNMDQTVRVFDTFNDYDVDIPVGEYDVVNSYFKSVMTTAQAADNFTSSLFRVAEDTGIPPLELLAVFQASGGELNLNVNIEASTTNNAIVSRKAAGIKTPGDLKGKRVGFTAGTTSDFFLDSFLTANGLTRQDIQPVALKPDEMQEAMTAKNIDAVSTWNYPLTLIAQKLGSDGIVFYDRQIYTETFNIATQQDFVKANPETVKSFLRALLKAETFVSKNPDEAQAIMAAATKIDKSLIRDVWNAFNYRVVLDQKLLLTLEDEARWAIKNKHTDKTVMPDYASYIHSDSLRAVRPEAVSTSR